MSRTIKLVINAKGETAITTKGYAGSSCRDASRFLEQALGQRLSESLTPEFHQAETTGTTIRQQS